jgi:hypothetical protein
MVSEDTAMLNQLEFDKLLKVLDQLSGEQKRILQERLVDENIQVHKPLKKRVAGLGEGTIWMSEDFIEPLPDEIWLGEDT